MLIYILEFRDSNYHIINLKHLSKMKKLLWLMLCSVTLLTSCNKPVSYSDFIKTGQDSVNIAQICKSVENPQFTNTSELLVYRDLCIENYETDSIFRSMQPDLLITIANVVINKYGFVDKKSLIEEYLGNRSEVYDYLKSKPDKNPEPVELDDTILTLPD